MKTMKQLLYFKKIVISEYNNHFYYFPARVREHYITIFTNIASYTFKLKGKSYIFALNESRNRNK